MQMESNKKHNAVILLILRGIFILIKLIMRRCLFL